MKIWYFIVVLELCIGTGDAFGMAKVATTAVTAYRDFSSVAAVSFNNVRIPATLIAGATVPLGIISAPQIKEDDTKTARLFKKFNMLLAIVTLINEVLSMAYSTVAINKISQHAYPPLANVSELITRYLLLEWMGAGVHFVVGVLGFACLAVSKPYYYYGKNIGDVTTCWTIAALMGCVAICNKGMASFPAVYNVLITYFKLLWSWAYRQGSITSIVAIGLILLSCIPLNRAWIEEVEGEMRRNLWGPF